MTGILIREVKAHREGINALSKLEFDDYNGVISCARDGKVRTWSFGLDMLGNLNLRTDRDDRKWKMPTKHVEIQ